MARAFLASVGQAWRCFASAFTAVRRSAHAQSMVARSQCGTGVIVAENSGARIIASAKGMGLFRGGPLEGACCRLKRRRRQRRRQRRLLRPGRLWLQVRSGALQARSAVGFGCWRCRVVRIRRCVLDVGCWVSGAGC